MSDKTIAADLKDAYSAAQTLAEDQRRVENSADKWSLVSVETLHGYLAIAGRPAFIASLIERTSEAEAARDALRGDYERVRKENIVVGDLSMLLRMMVTKHRRGKLDEEYCAKVLDYLQRKGLQGNILRADAALKEEPHA